MPEASLKVHPATSTAEAPVLYNSNHSPVESEQAEGLYMISEMTTDDAEVAGTGAGVLGARVGADVGGNVGSRVGADVVGENVGDGVGADVETAPELFT